MKLNEDLRKRIITDARFSLEVAYFITNATNETLKQFTLEHQAKRNSDRLLLPIYIDAYKHLGYTEDKIFEKTPAE